MDTEIEDVLAELEELVGWPALAAFDPAGYAAAWDMAAGNSGHPAAGLVIVVEDDDDIA